MTSKIRTYISDKMKFFNFGLTQIFARAHQEDTLKCGVCGSKLAWTSGGWDCKNRYNEGHVKEVDGRTIRYESWKGDELIMQLEDDF